MFLCIVLVFAVLVVGALSDAAVPYKLCGSGTPHITISSLSANVYPPKKGSSFNVTVNGTLDEAVYSGQWSASGTYEGFPLPSSSGDIAEFKPTPWQSGPLLFNYNVDVR